MKELSPIVLFVYNRIWHIEQTINALKKNDQAIKSDLFIFSDNAADESERKAVDSVRDFIKTVDGFKSVNINEWQTNKGLADSVITGVTEVIREYKKVIVLEDDIVCSKSFLSYMNKLLSFYQLNPKIFSVTGYTFPITIPDDYKYDVYPAPRASSWGWGTWIERWANVDWEVKDFEEFIENKEAVNKFNMGGKDLIRMLKNQINGKINSWAIRWTYAHFKNGAYCIYPTKSRLKNIGADKSGTHTNKTKRYDVQIFEDKEKLKLFDNLVVDKRIILNFRKFFSQNKFMKLFEYLMGTFGK